MGEIHNGILQDKEMIKLRLSVMSSGNQDEEILFKEKELLSSLVERVLGDKGLVGKERFFHVLINGNNVHEDFWNVIEIKESDVVLISPKLASGSFGEILKLAAVIVATTYTAGLFSATGVFASTGIGMTSAFACAGAAIATSLLMNALIPPPVQDGLGGDSSSNFESSQMYTLSSQGNASRKFGGVPKVYGTHRMFPAIAANPYTEIETDPETGELVQYFYCVYDFGFGPAIVEDLRLGDTPLTDYANFSTRFVDFHKPAISEGTWDDILSDSLTIYKGDLETDSTTIVLDENLVDLGPESGYSVIRNSAVNSDLSAQEITITFINPQGLIAYSTTGGISPRSIDMDILFSKVDENNWQRYNDPIYVNSFSAAGGNKEDVKTGLYLIPFSESLYFRILGGLSIVGSETLDQSSTSVVVGANSEWGLEAGTTYIIFKDNEIPVGDIIWLGEEAIGKVQSISFHSTGYSKYHLETPLTSTIKLLNIEERSYYTFGNLTGTNYLDLTQGRILNEALFRKYSGGFTISRQEPNAVYSTLKFTPKERGQFKIKITRVQSHSTGTYQIRDSLTIASITTRFDRNPIVTPNRHVFLELKIKATNQINGNISNLSGKVTSVLDTWDGTQWIKKPSSNPAWVFTDLLIGEVNKRKIDKVKLDLDSLYEWAQFCDEVPAAPPGQYFVTPRFQCNFILDFNTVLQELLAQVSGASQASLNMVGGKYGVLIDKLRTIPVQIFTPRNSSGFTSSRTYSDKPNSLKVKYIDPASNWEIVEKIVYDDGFTIDNAVTEDDLSTFGCTDPSQAWRFGRYMMAQNKLRQETISLTVDFEYLVCTRGDFVQISQDVMKVGGTPARVVSVSANTITIDEGIESFPVSYGYVFRGVTGIETNTLTIVDAHTFTLNGPLPSVGDLIVIGEVGSIVLDCLVKSITPNGDMSASLVLVEKADAVYEAESSSSFPDYSPRISITSDSEASPPPPVTDLTITANSWLCGANSFEHYMTIDWDVPVGTAFEFFEIYVNYGRGFDIVTTTKDSNYTYSVLPERIGYEHSFRVLAVSVSGKKIDLASATSVIGTPEKKTSNPMNVESMDTNITGEVLQLSWVGVNDCIAEYLIRYSPTLTGSWVASIPLMKVSKNTTSAATQARVGTYLIKAVDFNGNESASSTSAITTIPELTNLNIISEITDFPTLTGSKNQVVKNGNTLLIQNKQVGGVDINEYYSEGYYYYDNFLDLGEIYTVRLQSLIQAEGYTIEDIMANWVTLSSVTALANSKFSEWDVESQYRGTDSFNVMSGWVTLASIDPISEGVQDAWTEWKKFTMTDATFRIGQFRLRLISNKASVTPRVFDGTIKADMPDRTESFSNISATVSGYVATYSTPFKGPGTSPNIQVTIENAESGDYWAFDYKTLDGFKILFYDKTDTPVARVFDAVAKGFGRKTNNVI